MLCAFLMLSAALTHAQSQAATWQPLIQAMARVSAPSQADLNVSQSGTRAWDVRFRGSALQVSGAPLHSPVVPFAPDVETATLGVYGTMPTHAIHVGTAWFFAYYHGEFGGALWQFNADGSAGSELLAAPTYDLVRYGDEVLAATGSAAPFFFKPLRIHRFALRDGRWQEIGHVDFAYNLIDLTATGGSLYAMAQTRQGTLTLARISLSGNIEPLWDAADSLAISRIAVAANGDVAIGARGYVVYLRRVRNTFTAQWYAPPDCVRYSPGDDVQGDTGRCIAAPGHQPYERVAFEPIASDEASPDGEWMYAQYGPHLLHFAHGRWHEVALPEKRMYFSEVDDANGEPLLGAADELWTRRQGAWLQLAHSLQCSTRFSIAGGVAWCAGSQQDDWHATGIRFNGSTISADLRVRSGSPLIATGPDGDAWFTIPGAAFLGHIGTDGAVTRIRLSAPAAILSAGTRAVWFTESDNQHYGFIDAQSRLHELSWRSGSAVRGILATNSGAWLEETFPGQRTFFRHLRADGTDDGVFLADASSGIVTEDGTLYARSTIWPTILQLTENGALTRYRLPCAGGYLRLMPAPSGGVWFRGDDSGCSGLVTNGAIAVRQLPAVRTIYYK